MLILIKFNKKNYFLMIKWQSDSIAQHISKIDSLSRFSSQAFSDIGEPVKELDKIAKALGGLPMKYNIFVTAWDSFVESNETYDNNSTARLLKKEQTYTDWRNE